MRNKDFLSHTHTVPPFETLFVYTIANIVIFKVGERKKNLIMNVNNILIKISEARERKEEEKGKIKKEKKTKRTLIIY